MKLDEVLARAKRALDKPAEFGPDLDISKFTVATGGDEFALSKGRDRLSLVGIDLSEENRAGSYYQVDEKVIGASAKTPGLTVLPFEQALEEGFLENYVWKLVPPDLDKYTALNAMHGRRGYVVIAERGRKIAEPVQTCLFMSSPRGIQVPHNVIIAEEDSELSVYTGCTIMTEVVGLHAGVTEIYVKKGARVNFVMLHAWNEDAHVRPRTAVLVEEGGTYVEHYINMTPVASLQARPRVTLAGRGARAHLSSVIVAKKRSIMDFGGLIRLEGKETGGEIISRIIAKDSAKVTSRLRLEASGIGCKGHTECNGLMLSDSAQILTIPELLSSINDAELTHEAAVGKLKEEEIYYLTARGIKRDEAVAMLVRGFMNVKVEGLPPNLRRQIDIAVAMAAAGL